MSGKRKVVSFKVGDTCWGDPAPEDPDATPHIIKTQEEADAHNYQEKRIPAWRRKSTKRL